jgi:hypothetical protein
MAEPADGQRWRAGGQLVLESVEFGVDYSVFGKRGASSCCRRLFSPSSFPTVASHHRSVAPSLDVVTAMPRSHLFEYTNYHLIGPPGPAIAGNNSTRLISVGGCFVFATAVEWLYPVVGGS